MLCEQMRICDPEELSIKSYDIRNAAIVIVDLTGEPPNVFYELGIAHVLNKTTILLINKEFYSFRRASLPCYQIRHK